MAVYCAGCGEELMGSVNRCWRCGREFVSQTGPAEIPPIRRAPVRGPLDGSALDAEVIVESSQATDSADDPDSTATHAGRWKRRGSPFATDDEEAALAAPASTPQLAVYPSYPGRTGAAIASIMLAVFAACLLLAFPLGSLILAAVGIGLGCLALRGQRRYAAIFALLLCCIAFTVGGVLGTAQLYESVYGFSPWEDSSGF